MVGGRFVGFRVGREYEGGEEVAREEKEEEEEEE